MGLICCEILKYFILFPWQWNYRTNDFITILEHLAALCKERNRKAPQFGLCNGARDGGQWSCELQRADVCHFAWLFPQRLQAVWQRAYHVFILKAPCHQCRTLWTVHFSWAAMFCQWVNGWTFGYSLLCVLTQGTDSASPMLMEALAKCFCSQVAWQKWQSKH